MASKPAPKKAPPAKTPKAKKPAARKSAAGIGAPANRPKKLGAPSTYTPELAAAICEHIATGKSLRTIAALDGMPAQSTIMVWLDGKHPDFTEQYARAREAQADKLAEEILAIADDGRSDTYLDADGNEKTDSEVIQRSKLRVEARKWLASKMAPKKYGDKMAIGGADDLGPVQTVNREMTDAERAVRLSRAINDNPAALQALLAAIAKKGAAK
jgi:hypothetical protein